MTGGPACKPGRHGFTLVEVIASMTVISIVATASSGLIYNAAQAYRDISVRTRLHSAASLAMTRVCTELRVIPLSQSVPSIIPAIDRVTETSIAWKW